MRYNKVIMELANNLQNISDPNYDNIINKLKQDIAESTKTKTNQKSTYVSKSITNKPTPYMFYSDSDSD